jgi:DNA-binding transcriptional MerR regulator
VTSAALRRLTFNLQEKEAWMAEPSTKRATNGGGSDVLTLSEVSTRTKISMPTLQRYKKEYQNRLPSVGQGRKQRYPVEALEVFKAIKQENVGRRGRPRKDAGAPRRRKAAAGKGARRGRKPAAARAAKPARGRRAAGGGGLLTLTEIGKRTGISYPTLVRYVKLYLKRLPHEGRGRRRRFHRDAVAVFQELRGLSGRGRRAGGRRAKGGRKAAVGRPRAAAKAAGGGGDLRRLEKQLKALIKELKKPLKVTIARR